MKPKITYREKAGKLLIKITIHGQGKANGLYDTGITIDPNQWDEEKQICGDPSIQSWMIDTTNELLKSFRPDMNAKRLWMSFINNQTDEAATIKDAFEYYLANMPLRPNSKSVYVSVGRTLKRAGIYQTPLANITPSLLRLFMNGLKTSEASKFNTFVRIKACITRYIKDHQLKIAIDFEGIAKKPRYTMKENQWLTLEEVQKLLDAPIKWAKADARDLFCLCCFTGMSLSDALVFSMDNVKEINGRDFIVFNRIKTGSNCKVPLISQARKIIESRKWPTNLDMRAYQYQVSHNLGKIIDRKLNTHMGRKTFGALMLEFGFSIEAVSSMMGHNNVNLTQRVYTTITSKKIENEMDRVLKNGHVAFS